MGILLSDLTAALQGVGAPAHEGYAPSHAKLPYVVSRPLIVDPTNVAINGAAIDYDFRFSLHCAGASVEASFNLALAVMSRLQGARVGGSTLSASMGYAGAQVEGHYESQVTVQTDQGGI